jgi:hypothetical protein
MRSTSTSPIACWSSEGCAWALVGDEIHDTDGSYPCWMKRVPNDNQVDQSDSKSWNCTTAAESPATPQACNAQDSQKTWYVNSRVTKNPEMPTTHRGRTEAVPRSR